MKTPCAMCSKPTLDENLLFSPRGRVCAMCEIQIGEEESTENADWKQAAAGPSLAFMSVTFACGGVLPGIGLITAPIAPLLGVAGIIFGVQAFLRSGEAEEGMRTLLVLSGAASVLMGLFGLGFGAMMAFVQVSALLLQFA